MIVWGCTPGKKNDNMRSIYAFIIALWCSACAIEDVDYFAGTTGTSESSGASSSESSSTGEPCDGIACSLPDVDIDADIEPDLLGAMCCAGNSGTNCQIKESGEHCPGAKPHTFSCSGSGHPSCGGWTQVNPGQYSCNGNALWVMTESGYDPSTWSTARDMCYGCSTADNCDANICAYTECSPGFWACKCP